MSPQAKKRKSSGYFGESDASIAAELDEMHIKTKNYQIKHNVEIARLKSFIVKQSKEADSQIALRENEIKELKEQLSSYHSWSKLGTTNDNFEADNRKYQDKIYSLMVETDTLRQYDAEYQVKAEEARQKTALLVEQIQELERQLSAYHSWSNLGTENAEADKRKIKSLLFEVDKLKLMDASHRKEVEEAQRKTGRLAEKIKKLEEHYSEADAKNKELTAQNAAVTAELAETKKALGDEVIYLIKKKYEYKNNIDLLMVEIDKLKQKETEYQVKAEEDYEKTGLLVERIKKLEEHYSEADAKNKELTTQNASVKAELSKTQEALGDAVTGLNKKTSEYTAKINSLMGEIDQLKQQETEYNVKAEETRQEVDLFVYELQKQLSDAISTKNELIIQNAHDIAEFAKAEKAFKDEITGLAKMNSEFEDKITVMNSRIDDLAKKNVEHEIKYQESAVEYKNNIQAMKNEQEKSEAECKRLEDELYQATINAFMEDLLQKVEMKEKNARISDLGKIVRDLQAQLRQQTKPSYYEILEAHPDVSPKDLWMNDIRITLDKSLNEEELKKLLTESAKNSIDNIFIRFEDELYQTPNAFLNALTKVIKRCSNDYDKESRQHQQLITQKEALIELLQPIIDKYTQCKEEIKDNYPKRPEKPKAKRGSRK